MRTTEKKIAVAHHNSAGMKTGRSLSTRAARRANKKAARNRFDRLFNSDKFN